jgi:hypothetical protein
MTDMRVDGMGPIPREGARVKVRDGDGVRWATVLMIPDRPHSVIVRYDGTHINNVESVDISDLVE